MSKAEERATAHAEAVAALKRIQDYDVHALVRSEELGKVLSFQDVVNPAQRLTDLFKQVSIEVLSDFPTGRLNTIRDLANAEFNRFEQISSFSTSEGNPKAKRDSLIQQVENAYDAVFEQLWPSIAYSSRRSTDFARLEREARSSIQNIADRTLEIEKVLQKRMTEADEALEAIRKVAAEQGVSQQAIYFKNESDLHSAAADRWLKTTIWLTVAVGVYSIATLFLHKWTWLAPASPYDAAQLMVSKVLVFSTLVYFLFLASRNYMSNRHNAVVNKHRQNSLATYQALVEAAGDSANRDIVLTKASESIFAPEATGFVKKDGSDGGALSMVNLSPSLFRGPPGSA